MFVIDFTDSPCDNVKCDYGAQCEVKNEVAECVCPTVVSMIVLLQCS